MVKTNVIFELIAPKLSGIHAICSVSRKFFLNADQCYLYLIDISLITSWFNQIPLAYCAELLQHPGSSHVHQFCI